MKRSSGLAAAVGLHLLMLAVLLRHREPAIPEGAAPRRTQLVWAALKPKPPRPMEAHASVRASAPVRRTAPVETPPENIAAKPALSESVTPDNTVPLNPAELVRMAGAAGRELTAGEKITASPDSLQRKLERGMAAARDAVKPGFFEAARVELFSAPNDPRRIYKITTATGEYCVFYPDKNAMQGNDGAAHFGQPKVSSCPIRF